MKNNSSKTGMDFDRTATFDREVKRIWPLVEEICSIRDEDEAELEKRLDSQELKEAQEAYLKAQEALDAHRRKIEKLQVNLSPMQGYYPDVKAQTTPDGADPDRLQLIDANMEDINLTRVMEDAKRRQEDVRNGIIRDYLGGITRDLKKELSEGRTLDDILTRAFAAACVSARWTIGLSPFPVQMAGGIILHQGRIAEMMTGEGKTLVATMPAYLNALEGRGVYVVTVNDYLAKRDKEWMAPVYEALGLQVGCVLNSMKPDQRRAAYQCDITYVTNNELGFDYLRDNMAKYKRELVLRELHYAIIDEVDSILIDEARTPLIISGRIEQEADEDEEDGDRIRALPPEVYERCDNIARQLQRGENMERISKMDVLEGNEREESGDFMINEKEKIVSLTQQGIAKVERYFQKVQRNGKKFNLADAENLPIQHAVEMALRANYLMIKDRDYVVRGGEVLVVDQITGRVMPGRRYSDGLHQAIEAKEMHNTSEDIFTPEDQKVHIKVREGTSTLATITFQSFFNKFDKKAGMTGTAKTEEREFRDIYGLDVVTIPTNKMTLRIDEQDAVYKTKLEKENAVVEMVKEAHAKGQPVLIGTFTIEDSEALARRFVREGLIRLQKGQRAEDLVLNAKNNEKEAGIIANAGRHGAITIATNMAGRGTDIKLDARAKGAGGLVVIGTERYESRRVDNQLRGRSGRQGDPGVSKFFISLDDDLMRLFGSEKIRQSFETLGVPDGQEISAPPLTKAIERAQKKVEANNFGMRKNLIDYDQVMDEQREIIYKERRMVLDCEDGTQAGKDEISPDARLRNEIYHMIDEVVERAVNSTINESAEFEEWDLDALNRKIQKCIPIAGITPEQIEEKSRDGLLQQLKKLAHDLYDDKVSEYVPEEKASEMERKILLDSVDHMWMQHIDDMELLRQNIGLQAYAQRDPVVEYRMAGFDMFNEMLERIQERTVRKLFQARVTDSVERVQDIHILATNRDSGAGNAQSDAMQRERLQQQERRENAAAAAAAAREQEMREQKSTAAARQGQGRQSAPAAQGGLGGTGTQSIQNAPKRRSATKKKRKH